ncbi:CD209 antigen-like protein B isoform X2 [Dendropsophus ebraccatus]|uniref:CD209 antigen-like protein B isoform X2 n=1 Tax=Dendropsophus ebraccatus TaxID=150705 RepID=UPI0038316A4C
MEMNENKDGSGPLESGIAYINMDTFKTKVESCWGIMKSIALTLAILAALLVICVLLIVLLSRSDSTISREMESINVQVSQSMKAADTAQENLLDKMTELENLVSQSMKVADAAQENLLEKMTELGEFVSESMKVGDTAQENLLDKMTELENFVSESMNEAQENLLDKMTELRNLEYPRLSCPDGWYEIRSSCYYFSTTVGTWQDANTNCTALQSQLLIVTSGEEFDALVPLIFAKSFWIGLLRKGLQWTWVDGSPLSFSHWEPPEPNNLGGNENCVEMWAGGWNDRDCDDLMNYICKMG